MNRTRNILMVGPLSEVEPRMKQLASNLFTSLMMMESMERLEIAEEEYRLACVGDDAEIAREKEQMLKACEVTMQITIGLFIEGEETTQ